MEHAIAEAREARTKPNVILPNKSIKDIELSNEADCAQSRYCFPVAGTFKVRAKWIDERDLYVDANGRAFTEVMVDDCPYMMDAITGSLYRDGQCISSHALSISGLENNKEVAAKYLMSRRPNYEYLGLSKVEAIDGTR